MGIDHSPLVGLPALLRLRRYGLRTARYIGCFPMFRACSHEVLGWRRVRRSELGPERSSVLTLPCGGGLTRLPGKRIYLWGNWFGGNAVGYRGD
jgi:hypothetical protein